MTRYRDAAKKPPTTVEEEKFTYDGSMTGRKKTINYIWMPDDSGNLIKTDAARVKRSFASLSKEAQQALADYVISVQNRQPTDAARKTVFNAVIDAATESFKQGRKESPWDILVDQIANAPKIIGPTVTYTSYDRLLADTLLTKAARELGYQADIPEGDYADFLKKIQEAAKVGAKQREEVIRPDGTKEIIETPGMFDADQFARNYLWTKVNIGDPKNIPTTLINQIDSIRSIVKAYGLGYLSDKEIANYALQLSKGQTKLEDLQRDFSAKASEQYPLFRDRFAANPALTAYDLAQPYINQMAKRWEIDPASIDLNNPDLDKALRPDGTAGKMAMMSLAEWDKYLINHPNAEKTTWANENARQMATAFARMAGFGV
jgi:hypothetical protein